MLPHNEAISAEKLSARLLDREFNFLREEMMALGPQWSHDQEDITRELAILAEWQRLQDQLLTFPFSPSSQSIPSWRGQIKEFIHHITQERAYIWWQNSIGSLPAAFDRWFKLQWGERTYGLLGFTPLYLASANFHHIPQRFAQLCSLLLALAEYQTLVHYQLQQLPPISLVEPLTPREQEILLSLARGESETQISERLGITAATIHAHRQHLYQRLGVHSSQQAVLRAFETGLIDWLDLPYLSPGSSRSSGILNKVLQGQQNG